MAGMHVSVVGQPQTARETRRPTHTFNLRHIPYQIQPFFIAPVLPGETMKNLVMQARVVTDPVVNPLIGWWLEYYIFYVKHRDLNIRDQLTDMVLNPSFDPTTPVDITEAADLKYFHVSAGINWARQCLERVVEEFFRNEGEAWDDFTVDGMPSCSINSNTWLDSAVNHADISGAADTDIAVDVSQSTGTPFEVTAATVSAEAVDDGMRMWEFQRMNNLTELTYEEWLQTYGVRIPTVDEHRPELVRFLRDWSYPSNTIDPSDGSPTSAVSWSVAERADKDRFFKEPGFLFGCTVARPKVYLEAQTGSAVWFMDNAYSWLPAVLRHDPNSSWS